MSHPVCVWSNKFTSGWDGVSPPVEEHPVMDIREALLAAYDTDAHFTCGVAHPESQPRFNKWAGGRSTIANFEKIGVDIKFHVVALDVDRPGGVEQSVWYPDQLVRLGALDIFKTAGYYDTRGGYRLVWTLAEPIGPDGFEIIQRGLVATVAQVGVVADSLPDWTRCYRLPLVIRDGVRQYGTVNLDNLGHLDVTSLVDPVFDRPTRSQGSGGWSIDWTGGRNKALFKLGVLTLKGCPDMPDDLFEAFLGIANEMHYTDDPLPASELRQIASNARKYRPEPVAVSDSAMSDIAFSFGERQEVLVEPGELVRALDQTLAVMGRNKGAIYSMGGGLMRLKRDVEGYLYFDEIPMAALRAIIERMVAYVKPSKKAVDPIDAPKDLIGMVATMPDYGSNVWRLQEILTTPTLDPEGVPILSKGYHESLELYLDCPEELQDLDLTGDPVSAFDRVADLLCDIPFERPEHKAATMCSFITPVVRTAIRGPVPLILFDSTTRGSGKSLLADLTSMIATGRKSVVQPYVDETEFEKRVTALLQMGLRTILIDNIDKPFGGATLDALLTADMWTGRVLGETKMIKFRSRAHWMATGNNIQIKGDLDRRALRCYIAPGMERPEERRSANYKYPNIKAHVLKYRRQYVQDILTFVKAYMDAGCPRPESLKELGSFEEWSRVVRGAVIHYGMVDPVISQDALRADGAPALWLQAMRALEAIYKGPDGFSARDVLIAGSGAQGIGPRDAHITLEGALEELIGTKPTVKLVAAMLKRWVNRVIDGVKLVKMDTRDRTKGNMYKVVPA